MNTLVITEQSVGHASVDGSSKYRYLDSITFKNKKVQKDKFISKQDTQSKLIIKHVEPYFNSCVNLPRTKLRPQQINPQVVPITEYLALDHKAIKSSKLLGNLPVFSPDMKSQALKDARVASKQTVLQKNHQILK